MASKKACKSSATHSCFLYIFLKQMSRSALKNWLTRANSGTRASFEN